MFYTFWDTKSLLICYDSWTYYWDFMNEIGELLEQNFKKKIHAKFNNRLKS